MPQANPSDFLDVIKLFIPIFAPLLAILLTGIVGVAIFRQTSPNLQIQITSSWIQNSFGLYLLIRAEIENISKIRVYKRRVEGGRFQILEHELTQVSVLSEWVPFSEGDIRPTEKPIHWREPFSIIDKTKHLDPGENIPVERLYRMGDKKNIVLHIGVQFKGAVGILGTRIIKRTTSWTRTCIVFMPQETSSKKPKT